MTIVKDCGRFFYWTSSNGLYRRSHSLEFSFDGKPLCKTTLTLGFGTGAKYAEVSLSLHVLIKPKTYLQITDRIEKLVLHPCKV